MSRQCHIRGSLIRPVVQFAHLTRSTDPEEFADLVFTSSPEELPADADRCADWLRRFARRLQERIEAEEAS